VFAFIEGEPVAKGSDYVVLAVGGLGFRVFVPPSRVEAIAAAARIKLHTHLALREDGMVLYGLENEAELAVFRQLISVSGVGPRLAMAVLSTWKGSQLQAILAREDIAALTTVPGVGRKTAQRLLLELKDKIEVVPVGEEGSTSILADAEAALAALGFRAVEARPVLRALAKECTSTEDLVRTALSRLAGGEK
jgi:Holliday junction DNA helicase RuvA